MKTIRVQELKAALDNNEALVLVDVREPSETQVSTLPKAVTIPLGQILTGLADQLNDLPKDTRLVMQCRSGGRSGQATLFLESQGFTNVSNLEGGILAWKDQIDPTIAVG